MSSFCYFTEQAARPVSLEDVRGWGLGYAFDERPSSMEITGRTPTGGKGWLFFDDKRMGSATRGFNAAIQEWRKIPGTEIWVGFDKVKRPGPGTLARKDRLSGILIQLQDGNEWSIPKLCYHSGKHGFVSNLTRYLTLDESGEWTAGRVKGGNDHLDDLGMRLAQALVFRLLDESIPELQVNEGGQAVAVLLQANYFLGPTEIAMLDLLTEENLMPALHEVVDYHTAVEFLKKNSAALGG